MCPRQNAPVDVTLLLLDVQISTLHRTEDLNTLRECLLRLPSHFAWDTPRRLEVIKCIFCSALNMKLISNFKYQKFGFKRGSELSGI